MSMVIKLKRVLSLGMLALALSGCKGDKPQYLEGKVIKECGRKAGTDCFLFKGDASTVGNVGSDDYNLLVETDNGEYTLNVYSGTYGKSLHSLAQEIEIGSKIKFQTNYRSIESFGANKRGSLSIEAIEVLKK